MTSATRLLLLADNLKLTLLERERSTAFGLDPDQQQDTAITASLHDIESGISELSATQEYTDEPEDEQSPDLARLRREYEDLYTQYHGYAPPKAVATRQSHDQLQDSSTLAAQTRPQDSRRSKSVRFRDAPGAEDDAQTTANRAALFSSQQQPYQDEPAVADQSQQDTQQIHAYHKQALQDQDAQLDVLGQSIGRQRILGIQMGDELDEQGQLLDDVEAGVDRHTSTLDRARKRLGHVARKGKGNWSWVTIGILICVLVLLIVVLK